jgi:hypothetical protein
VTPLKEGEEKPIVMNNIRSVCPPSPAKKKIKIKIKTTTTMGWMLA